MNLDTYSLMVERIYDAATESQLWPLALRTIAEAFRGHASSLIFRDMTTMEGQWISTLEPATETEYFVTWRNNNILVDHKQDWRPGAIETDRNWLPKTALLRSDFYAGFMHPHDIYAVIRTLLRREGMVQPSLTIARNCAADDFDQAEVALAQRLMPHMQHAVSIAHRLGDTRFNAGDAAETLDRLGHAIVVLDDAGAPVHVNRAAERLLGACDGLTVKPDGLQAATPALTAQLALIVARAAGRAGDMPAAGSVALERPSGKRPLALFALPLRGQFGWLPSCRRMVLVCIADPAAATEIRLEHLASLFGLTPSEAKVARELMTGHDVSEIATRLRSSVHTVRTHMARLMAKTETRRQSELVRLLASLPPLQHDDA